MVSFDFPAQRGKNLIALVRCLSEHKLVGQATIAYIDGDNVGESVLITESAIQDIIASALRLRTFFDKEDEMFRVSFFDEEECMLVLMSVDFSPS